jgi:hypothetical protein
MGAGGFQNLPGALHAAEQQGAMITKEEVRASDARWSDEVALGVVVADVSSTLAYYQSKGLVPLGIENADDLVRGYVRPRQWPDGKPRANLSMHVTLQAIEKLIPALYMSLFAQGKRRPFIIEPVGKTKPEAARANASLLAYGIKESKLKEEMRVSLKTALTYGFTIGGWGWESKKIRKKVYAKNADGKMVGKLKPVEIELPKFEALDLKLIGVDPGLKRQDVQHGAKFIYRQYYTDGYGLEDLRLNPSYKDIPEQSDVALYLAGGASQGVTQEPTTDSLAESKRAVWREMQAKLENEASSKDPMTQPLEIIEYWTEDRVVVILQRKLVIRNEENEFGRLPFQSCAFIDVLGSAWGFGVAKLLAGEQRLQQGVVNNWIDSLALVLNPVYQLLKGVGPGTQSIPVSPGKVITESGELKPLITPDVTKPAMEAIATSDQRANDKIGANGGSNMPNAAMRTAEGVNAFAGDIIQRLQYFLEQFINLVYIPTLEAYLDMMHDHLTVEQINDILTTEEGKAYEGEIEDVYNAECRLDVVAGANMMAKFAAAQLAPMVIQLVSAGPVADQLEVAGVKFDYAEFISETLDMMGWDLENLIVPMTQADLQRVQQKNAAMIKAQTDMALQGQKHQDALSEIDAKASGQAGVATVRQVLKTHSDAALQQLDAMQSPEGASQVGQ